MENSLTGQKLVEFLSKLGSRYEDLPGGDIFEQGLGSLDEGRVDENSLPLMIGALRLGQCGIEIKPLQIDMTFREDKLYQLLAGKHGSDAYRIYNSLTRRLVSLENAMEHLVARRK